MGRASSGSQNATKQKKKRTTIAEVDLYATSSGRYTPRSFIQTGDDAWRTLRQLSHLTPLEFRRHLAKDLTELGLIEESRRSLLDAIGTPPQKDAFWLTLQDIVQDYQLTQEVDFSLRVLDAKYSPSSASWFRKFRQSLTEIHVIPWRELPEDSSFWENQQDMPVLFDTRWEEVFRKSFVQNYGKPPPTEWIREASTILTQLFGIQDQAGYWYQRRVQWLQNLWERGKEAGLLTAIREGLLTESWVTQAIADLQWRHLNGESREIQEQARDLLKQVGKALSEVGQGKIERSPKEKEAIVDACKKWRPICEEINKVFKKLWKRPQYQASERYRKEAGGMLAEKLGIPVADVQTIEAFLSNPSRTAGKRTPYDAMLHRVAREFPDIGKKTVENI